LFELHNYDTDGQTGQRSDGIERTKRFAQKALKLVLALGSGLRLPLRNV